MSKFKSDLIEKFKEKGLADSSIHFYIRNIEKLNGDQPLSSLLFLKNKEDIMKFLGKFKPNTKRNYLISIVSTLGLDPKNKKLFDMYYPDMMAINKELKSEEAKNEKSETQKANWMPQEEVDEIVKRYQESFNKIKDENNVSVNSYDMLLRYVVLSLYTMIPPRRNKDYQNAYLIKGVKPDDDKNYVDVTNKQFIFNDFKTVKHEGQQVIKIPDDLMNIINVYIKFHPLIEPKEKTFDVPFLVNHEGIPFADTTVMTKLLNKIFQKKVGSTMLRHMYLSNKYGKVLEEQKKDAHDMGHSTTMQKDYVKK